MIAREVPGGSISAARSEASARWRGAAIDSVNRQAVRPAEAPATSPESVRETLRQAQACLAEAESVRDAATKVLTSAQLELGSIDRECGVLRQEADAIAGARAKRLTVALKGGSSAKIEPDDRVVTNARRVAELGAERAAWSKTVDALAAEARTAGEGTQRAREAVDAAIRGVLIAEANAIAEEAERLAAAALKLRLRIGPIFGPIDAIGSGLSEATKRAIRANAGVTLNSPEAGAAKAHEIVWRVFEGALARDADAEPAFDL